MLKLRQKTPLMALSLLSLKENFILGTTSTRRLYHRFVVNKGTDEPSSNKIIGCVPVEYVEVFKNDW